VSGPQPFGTVKSSKKKNSFSYAGFEVRNAEQSGGAAASHDPYGLGKFPVTMFVVIPV